MAAAVDRGITFNALFNLIQGPKTIVETGTIRSHLWDYKIGDGHSTLRFAEYCSRFGGKLYSIDIDPHAVVVSKSLVAESFPNADVEVIESDSVAYLKSFEQPIDVLYLDSANDANVILNEAKAALRNLTPESLVLIDDCFNKGDYDVEKGELVIPFLEENGWIMETSEYQALFIHKDRF
jgi:predicted O-methyltransferase YrrM|tara:strand:- start:4083 stop:4622 length:540 start_codon:yes stop_codon:yes gene_type:complete